MALVFRAEPKTRHGHRINRPDSEYIVTQGDDVVESIDACCAAEARDKARAMGYSYPKHKLHATVNVVL